MHPSIRIVRCRISVAQHLLRPIGAHGLELRHKIADDKFEAKNERFEPGPATPRTGNKAAISPDPDGMAEPRHNSKTMTARRGALVFDIAVGLAGGLLATAVTNLVQGLLRRLTPARIHCQERRVSPARTSSLAAAEKLAPLLPIASSPKSKEAAGVIIHFATGMVWGPTYGLLRRYTRWHPVAAAAASGTTMSLVLDETLVPQLGLSAPNHAYPVYTHLRGLVAHLVYGAALALAVEMITPFAKTWVSPSLTYQARFLTGQTKGF
jgi:uncharacterized membrane protein YagU involved in acid resistance